MKLPSSDQHWLIPAAAMTAGLSLFVVVFAPSSANYLAALGLLPLWTLCAVVISLTATLPLIFRMMRSGEDQPLRALMKILRKNSRGLLIVFVGFELAGLNMIAFMWAKPLLNYLVPFWADPLLLKIDYLIFFGALPDLSALNTPGLAVFYHRGWFALMIAGLLYALTLDPSPRKTSILVTYFALWTLAGPLIHALLPAGGPIFYERLGNGALSVSSAENTARMADYLWRLYSETGFGPGAGISAMPSLHIATTVWVCLMPKGIMRWPTYAASFLIYLLSVSLGWHYWVDGIAGGLVAVAMYGALNGWLTSDPGLHSSPQDSGLASSA